MKHGAFLISSPLGNVFIVTVKELSLGRGKINFERSKDKLKFEL